MSWLTELGYNDKRDKENPLFTQETKEKTVDTIQRLVIDRLVAYGGGQRPRLRSSAAAVRPNGHPNIGS